VIICLFFNNNIISNIFLFGTYISKNIEIKKIEKYFEYCNDNTKKIKQLKKIKNPKISIISPIYNREKFISRFIESIYNQNFQDIEIIFVDDNSNDNGVNLIEKFIKRDKRIILIKNKKNRGTFVARNLGVLISKAKYVIIPDPDDILSRDIIRICYKYGEKYQYDFIRFYSYKGNGKFLNNNFRKFQKNKAIYQPELSTFIYYGNFNLQKIDSYINNKFIKKTVYIKALNALNNFYSNMYMIYMEDSLMNYLLHRTAKSLYFIKNIGYRYKKTSESITKKIFKMPQMKLKFIFIYYFYILIMKFLNFIYWIIFIKF
jgi:glycosyltransferase involved in cell wall biosynthesis